jgi:hypothetical protein
MRVKPWLTNRTPTRNGPKHFSGYETSYRNRDRSAEFTDQNRPTNKCTIYGALKSGLWFHVISRTCRWFLKLTLVGHVMKV